MQHIYYCLWRLSTSSRCMQVSPLVGLSPLVRQGRWRGTRAAYNFEEADGHDGQQADLSTYTCTHKLWVQTPTRPGPFRTDPFGYTWLISGPTG